MSAYSISIATWIMIGIHLMSTGIAIFMGFFEYDYYKEGYSTPCFYYDATYSFRGMYKERVLVDCGISSLPYSIYSFVYASPSLFIMVQLLRKGIRGRYNPTGNARALATIQTTIVALIVAGSCLYFAMNATDWVTSLMAILIAVPSAFYFYISTFRFMSVHYAWEGNTFGRMILHTILTPFFLFILTHSQW